jgi:hypothetical protein
MNTTQSQTELEVIKKIMEDSRKVIIDNGWHYIFWGIVVTCALIANYFMILEKVRPQYYGLMWFIAMMSAWIAEIIIERRIQRKRGSKTFAGRLISSLWSMSGISMFIFGFVGTITGAYNPVYICPIISVVLGSTYLISGAIQQIKWMQMLTTGWWSGALYMFLFPQVHTLLIFAIMILCFQVTPGIILYIKWRKSKVTAA